MNSKARIAQDLYNILENVDCFENCPLKDICDIVEKDSHNATVCRFLDHERNVVNE